ncbi:MAG: response regulator [Deltaproteobacteria bacterium]|nr:response regulator [Deltaproteobacteria bacterium]
MTIRVLILEDDPGIASLLTRALGKWGFDVTLERNGAKGVEHFSNGGFDVALIDGLLPGRNGFAIASRIRALKGGDKIGLVMMSAAFRNAQAKNDAHNAGFDAFYAKPFVIGELREKLVELADKYTGAQLKPQKLAPAKPQGPRSTRAKTIADIPAAKAKSAQTNPPKQSNNVKVHDAASSASVAKTSAAAKTSDEIDPLFGQVTQAAVSPVAPRTHTPRRPAFKVDSGSLTLEERAIRDVMDLPWTLKNLARSHATGVLSLRDQDAVLELAMLRGVVVGAWDNMRENVLAERLWRRKLLEPEQMQRLTDHIRATGEQVGEAALSLDLLDEKVILEQIELQVRDRLLRALSWHQGRLKFIADQASVERMAVSTQDLVLCLLERCLNPADPRAAHATMTPRLAEGVRKTQDFEHGLTAFARLCPTSRVPTILLSQDHPSLSQVLGAVGAGGMSELYAMWFAGMVRLDEDPVAPARAIPCDFAPQEVADEIVDAEAVSKVRRLLLRARGNSFYSMLKVENDAHKSVIQAAIKATVDDVGQMAIGNKRLGPARAAARELWALLEEAEATLLDDGKRKSYDSWSSQNPTTHAYRFTDEAERYFLDGRLALAARGFEQAAQSFEKAVSKKPLNADYLAFMAWSQFLVNTDVNAGNAEAVLQAANTVNPQAMRPFFFLGMLYRQKGRLKEAREALTEAVRRAPDDSDVLAAYQSLQVD